MKKILITLITLVSFTVAKAQISDTAKHDQADNSPLFVAVEYEPEFPGGTEKMVKIILNNIHYSNKDINKNGLQTHFVIQMIIDKDGSTSNITVSSIRNGKVYINDPNSVLSKEIIRVFKSFPRWKPAIQNGHPVRFRYVFPISLERKSE